MAIDKLVSTIQFFLIDFCAGLRFPATENWIVRALTRLRIN